MPRTFAVVSRRNLDESGATISRLGGFVTVFCRFLQELVQEIDLNETFSPFRSGFRAERRRRAPVGAGGPRRLRAALPRGLSCPRRRRCLRLRPVGGRRS